MVVKTTLKKIPVVFQRDFDEETGRLLGLTRRVTPGCEWVLEGLGEATEKVDGAACAILGGKFYRRYDAKAGQRRLPDGATPCTPAPDPYTGHWPCWLPVSYFRTADKWFCKAWENTPWCREDGTYEAVGPHFQSNPYGLDEDVLERHGRIKIPDFPRDFSGMRDYLSTHEIEGVVFWLDGEPMCKIRRKDFGLKWPPPKEEE